MNRNGYILKPWTDLRKAGLRKKIPWDDLRGRDLTGANLESVDLSRADLRDARLRGADLSYSDLRGADLRKAKLSGAKLSGAKLSGAMLRGAMLRGAMLRGAKLSDSDLRETDLRETDLRDADLRGAKLSGADLRKARLPEVPQIPDIHRAIYAAVNRPRAIDIYEWHPLMTIYCRAEWTVILAGEAGAELERRLGTGAAAALIYAASDPDLPTIPDWYASENDAFADMARMAEEKR